MMSRGGQMLHLVRVNSFGRFRCPASWSLTPERTTRWPDYVLWYLIDGYGRVDAADRTMPLRPGVQLVLRGGEPYTFVRTSPDPFVHYWAHFEFVGPYGETLSERGGRLPPPWRQMHDTETVERLWARLVEPRSAPDVEAPEVAVWLSAILEEIRRDDHVRSGETARDDPRVSRLREKIQRDPGRSLSVEAMARESGCSRSQLFRRFRAATGLSPQQYLVQTRMHVARVLLQDSDSTIAAIAATLGYQDAHAFSRHFKRHHGQSPSSFRSGA